MDRLLNLTKKSNSGSLSNINIASNEKRQSFGDFATEISSKTPDYELSRNYSESWPPSLTNIANSDIHVMTQDAKVSNSSSVLKKVQIILPAAETAANNMPDNYDVLKYSGEQSRPRRTSDSKSSNSLLSPTNKFSKAVPHYALTTSSISPRLPYLENPFQATVSDTIPDVELKRRVSNSMNTIPDSMVYSYSIPVKEVVEALKPRGNIATTRLSKQSLNGSYSVTSFHDEPATEHKMLRTNKSTSDLALYSKPTLSSIVKHAPRSKTPERYFDSTTNHNSAKQKSTATRKCKDDLLEKKMRFSLTVSK